jgi:transcriptional regulator of acetoin/glycerol metabolism
VAFLIAATAEEAAAFRSGGGRATRRDALPEHTRYVDSGCELHTSCLTCPLVRCRYDEPGGVTRIVSRARDQSMLQVRREDGLTIEAIARRFGVSRRTVFRVLARARDEETARW